MSRFDTLSLLDVPVPDIVEVPAYEDLLSSRMADLATRMAAAGIPYDVGALETDPLKINQEISTERHAILLARINDAVRAVYLASSGGTDLDNFVLDFDLRRAVGEDDASLQQRRLVAPEAMSTAGPGGAYDFHVLDSCPGLIADTISYGPEDQVYDGTLPFSGAGIVASVYLPRLDCTVPAPVMSRRIAAALNSYSIFEGGQELVVFDKAAQAAQDKRPLSDCHKIRCADVVDYAIEAQLVIPDGPDASIVTGTAEARLTALGQALYAIDTGVARQLLEGACVVFDANGAPLVTRLTLVSPPADLPPLPLGAYRCTGVAVYAVPPA